VIALPSKRKGPDQRDWPAKSAPENDSAAKSEIAASFFINTPSVIFNRDYFTKKKKKIANGRNFVNAKGVRPK
jgi:hypothetical protein